MVRHNKPNPNRNPAPGSFFYLAWWLVWTGIAFAYVSLTDPVFRTVSPWYLWLTVTIGPILIIQALFYRLALRRFLAVTGKSAALRAIIMIAAVLTGFFVLLMFDFIFNVNKIRT